MSDHSDPRISVVILSYKNFEQTTAGCFRSLTLDPQLPEWEVIIVDNDSGPETRHSLAELGEQFPTVRFLLNESNLGFAGGFNSGLREATGDVICLLNSDTMIADGAIGRLAERLRAEQLLGMAGPVTNAAGNEQKIYVNAKASPEEIIREGARYADCGSTGRISAYRLDFCVVALKRELYEAIGGLDEAFGRGYYEDFDYSLRARNAGFDLEVAEDAFVYHQGSASFGPADTQMKALIAANKRRLIEKHGSNTFFPHVRDANLSILRQYAEQIAFGESPPEYRIRNRLRLAGDEQPRSPLKRWRYKRRIAAVSRALVAAHRK